jgi:hypothetical protein
MIDFIEVDTDQEPTPGCPCIGCTIIRAVRASRAAKEANPTPKPMATYIVKVEGFGTVYMGERADVAEDVYAVYVEESKAGVPKYQGKAITIAMNGDVYKEYQA